ncbi:NAC domain-containing protein 2-like isoform X1 [Typha latifolia]|uniref:NAC domain-containing protein 2-like isoform X1 n=1 Tax=Typha latifolia TaxID=4733 RepID=UPI003C2C8A73
MAAAKRTLRLTPGIQFSDSELVGHYLRKKLCGEKLPDGVRPEIDLYCAHPDRLTGTKLPKITPFLPRRRGKTQFHPPNRFSEWYFFTSAAHRKHEPGVGLPPRKAGQRLRGHEAEVLLLGEGEGGKRGEAHQLGHGRVHHQERLFWVCRRSQDGNHQFLSGF